MMIAEIFASLFQYLNAWMLIAFVVAAAVVSEKLYFAAFSAVRGKVEEGGAVCKFPPLVPHSRSLPGGARRGAALYCPVFAFAALLTVCACLPICTYIPIIDNGADIVQLAQFMLLSEVFVLMSLYAAGTEEALEIARTRDAEHDPFPHPVYGAVRLCRSLPYKERGSIRTRSASTRSRFLDRCGRCRGTA